MSEEIPPTDEKKIPLFLYITYVVVLLWGLWAFYAYWNGSQGFLGHGYWRPLQKAAATTYPFEKKSPHLHS